MPVDAVDPWRLDSQDASLRRHTLAAVAVPNHKAKKRKLEMGDNSPSFQFSPRYGFKCMTVASSADLGGQRCHHKHSSAAVTIAVIVHVAYELLYRSRNDPTINISGQRAHSQKALSMTCRTVGTRGNEGTYALVANSMNPRLLQTANCIWSYAADHTRRFTLNRCQK